MRCYILRSNLRISPAICIIDLPGDVKRALATKTVKKIAAKDDNRPSKQGENSM